MHEVDDSARIDKTQLKRDWHGPAAENTMVAAQRTLLSLAAALAAMFSIGGKFCAAAWTATAEEEEGETSRESSTLSLVQESLHPLRFHRRQLNSTSSAASSTTDDYVYPPDVASGAVQTRFGTGVPEATGHLTSSVGLGNPAKYPSSNQGPTGSGEGFIPTTSRVSWSGAINNTATPTMASNPESLPLSPPSAPTTTPATQLPQVNATTTQYPNTTSFTSATQQGTTTGVVTMTSGEYSGTYRWCSSADLAVTTVTVYPSTNTFFGIRSEYTPPVAETTPERTCRDGTHRVRLTLSHCVTGKAESCQTTLATLTPEVGIFTIETSTAGAGLRPYVTMPSAYPAKNPSVVFSPFSTPSFGGATTKQAQEHESTAAGGGGGPMTLPSFDTGDGPPARNPAGSPITLAVQPSGVVINGQTFSDQPVGGRQTITKDGQTFTIDPTAVVGAGASVNRPAVNGGVFVPTPVTTNIGGLDVVVSSSVAVVDGTTFTIPGEASTAVVRGQTVSFGPDGIAIASETIPVSRSPIPTEVVLAGGEAITAIGRSVVVIRDTTITYGPGSPQHVTMIDGESIIIGSTGVVVHGTTLGGMN